MKPGKGTTSTWGGPGLRRWLWGGLVLSVVALAFAVVSVQLMRSGWWAALAGDKPGPGDYARWGTCWATTINALLLVSGALFVMIRLNVIVRGPPGAGGAGKAGGRKPEAGSRVGERARKVVPRREWLWLILVLALAGGLRWTRMGLSLYNDEAHAFRTYIAGRFRQAADGNIEWRQAKWSETLWLNKVGNNVTPCSLFGRLFYDAWRKISGSPEGMVSETAVRLPQFIAGMGSLAVLWLAVRRMSGARAAWCALILAALHPWHVRYSTEARGYGFLLLGVVCCFHFLQRALEDDRWRWWISLGLAQFLCIWSFPGSVYFLTVFDAAVVVVLSFLAVKRRAAWFSGVRFSVGLLLGAMLALQLMLPLVPQLMDSMQLVESKKGVMGFTWWVDALSGMFFGIRGWDWDPVNPDNLALLRETTRRTWTWAVVAIVVVSWAAGTVRLMRDHVAGAILALTGPVAVLLSWVVMSAEGKFMHPWYLVFAVPSVVVSVTAGLGWLEKRSGASAGRLATGVSALVIATAWLSADLVYARHGKENLRGLAEAGRGGAQPRGVYAAMIADVDVYDPRVVILKTAAALDDEVTRARKEGLPLMVSVGHVGIGESPQAFDRLRGSGEFEEAGVFRGLEEAQFTHHLFRLRGAQ